MFCFSADKDDYDAIERAERNPTDVKSVTHQSRWQSQFGSLQEDGENCGKNAKGDYNEV